MMNTASGVGAGAGRFASVLEGGSGPPAIYDEVLAEIAGCVVAPTLGSILPKWLLVIPRTAALNFAIWSDSVRCDPAHLVSLVLNRYGIAHDRAIWFEHGAMEPGSLVGCGVDQAHLHVLVDAPFTFEQFADRASKAGRYVWKSVPTANAYSSLDRNAAYLLVGCNGRAITAHGIEHVGSQFLRRVVAELANDPERWDYRSHPHLEHVEETVRSFRQLAA